MRTDFRTGFRIGIIAAVGTGVYCFWLWQAERQIARHTENLFRKIEHKNWSAVGDLVADDYRDQWNNDRALVLERIRLVLGYGRHLRVSAADIDCTIEHGVGVWRGKISIESDDSEFAAVVKERVNLLTAPFELQWRHVSGKPWDWKLVRVSNPELEIPAGFE